MKHKTALLRGILVLLLFCLVLGVRQSRRDLIHLQVSPPPQLIAGETAMLSYAAPAGGAVTVHSSNAAVAEIAVQSAADGMVSCLVTAQADGSATLSCTIGGRSAPSYAVSVVPPADIPLTDGDFVASRSSTRVHRISCRFAERIRTENRIYFANIQDAEGYIPCTTCKP